MKSMDDKIIDLAKKRGLSIPAGLEKREILYFIADQLEIDFQYSDESAEELLQILMEEYEPNSSFEPSGDEEVEALDESNEEQEVKHSSDFSEGDSFPNQSDNPLLASSGEEDSSTGGSSPNKRNQKEENPASFQNDLSNNSPSKKEIDKDSSFDGTKDKQEDSKKEEPEKNPNTQGDATSPKKNSSLSGGQGGDETSYASSNLQHQKKIQQGKDAEESGDSKGKGVPKKTKNDKQKIFPKGEGSGSKGLKRLFNHKLGGEKGSFRLGDLKTALLKFFTEHKILCFSLVVLLVVFIIILIVVIEDAANGGGKTGTRCNYELKGVIESGTVSLNDVQVELINCDGTPSDYTILGTVDFEKYVIGVALAEIGSSSPDEAIKAQIVAARNFALTRNSGMCPGSPSTCFYGYNVNSNTIRMRACEADQVYWDYTKDNYREDRGSISLYSPEVDASSGVLWHSALSDERISEINTLAEEVRGVVLLDDKDYVLKTPYNASVSVQFQNDAKEGKDYQEILSRQYGSDNFHTSVCSSYGVIDYGDYVLDSTGHQIIKQDLASFLQSKGTSLEEFNQLIADNVDKAGYGTRAGVVVAGVTLVGELGNQYGVKLPYFWGGGHADGVADSALAKWGSNQCSTYANNQWYRRCGLDCSGFIPWVMRTGGYNISRAYGAGSFYRSLPGAQRVSLKSTMAVLEPGDFIESNSHITMVVSVDEANRQYIVVHASGNQSGILFSRFAFDASSYWGVKMDGYYNNPQNIRSR